MADTNPNGPYTERSWRMLHVHKRVVLVAIGPVPPLLLMSCFAAAYGKPVMAALLFAAMVVTPIVVFGAYELYCRIQKRHAIYHTQGQMTTVREAAEWSAEKLRDYFAQWDMRRFAQWWIQQITHGMRAMGGHKGRAPRNDPGSIRIRYRWTREGTDAGIVESMRNVPIGSQPAGPTLVATAYRQSGMAIPSITEQATEAMARGVAGLCMLGTGEGSLWEEHLAGGPSQQVEFQIGTGNFGCRNEDGTFNMEKLLLTVADPRVVAIQVKISQGAKQDGGKAPGWKVNARVATKRGIPEGKDCFSPERNPSIDGIPGLVRFVREVRAATGRIVGVKMAIGSFAEFDQMCRAWAAEPDGMPDYLQIDGGEGGTGAAYEEIMKCGGLDASTAIQAADLLLRKHGLRGRVKILGSAGGLYPEDLVRMYALGADMVATGRGFKYMVGCIGASKCHIGREQTLTEKILSRVRAWAGLPPLGARGECPTGIAANGEVIDPIERGRWVRAAVIAMFERTAHLLQLTGVRTLDQFVGTRLKHIEIIGVHIWTLREVENIIAVERADWTLDTPAIPETERSA